MGAATDPSDLILLPGVILLRLIMDMAILRMLRVEPGLESTPRLLGHTHYRRPIEGFESNHIQYLT